MKRFVLAVIAALVMVPVMAPAAFADYDNWGTWQFDTRDSDGTPHNTHTFAIDSQYDGRNVVFTIGYAKNCQAQADVPLQPGPAVFNIKLFRIPRIGDTVQQGNTKQIECTGVVHWIDVPDGSAGSAYYVEIRLAPPWRNAHSQYEIISLSGDVFWNCYCEGQF